jgi:hypothetical protein
MTTPKNKGFRTRRRDSSREDVNREEELEKFFSEAEEPRVEELTIDQRVERRAQGRYFNATSYRTTEEQKELLKFAAAQSGKSVQAYMEDIIMPTAERDFGQAFDQQR